MLVHIRLDTGDGGFLSNSVPFTLDIPTLDTPEVILLVESQVVLRECPAEKNPESRESREEIECHALPVAPDDGVVVFDPGEIFIPPYSVDRSCKSPDNTA